MAELVLKIGDSPVRGNAARYVDGDIVEAFSRRRIRAIHAGVLCHVKHAELTPDGYRPMGSLAQLAREHSYQTKFERISQTEIRCEDRWNKVTEIVPYSVLELFIQRRLQHPRHGIFGALGAELWYGGKVASDHKTLDLVWHEIEAHSAEREADYDLAPTGTEGLKAFYWVSVDDFDESEAARLVAPVFERLDAGLENERVRVKRMRSCKVSWRGLPGMDVGRRGQIEDKKIDVDDRKLAVLQRAAIVEDKPAMISVQ